MSEHHVTLMRFLKEPLSKIHHNVVPFHGSSVRREPELLPVGILGDYQIRDMQPGIVFVRLKVKKYILWILFEFLRLQDLHKTLVLSSGSQLAADFTIALATDMRFPLLSTDHTDEFLAFQTYEELLTE